MKERKKNVNKIKVKKKGEIKKKIIKKYGSFGNLNYKAFKDSDKRGECLQYNKSNNNE